MNFDLTDYERWKCRNSLEKKKAAKLRLKMLKKLYCVEVGMVKLVDQLLF